MEVFQNTPTHFLFIGLLFKASLLNTVIAVIVYIHALYICSTGQSAKLAKYLHMGHPRK